MDALSQPLRNRLQFQNYTESVFTFPPLPLLPPKSTLPDLTAVMILAHLKHELTPNAATDCIWY